jgi:hypothetical protein
MPLIFGGQGVQPSLRGQPSNVYALQAGEAKVIPAGAWVAKLGPYTNYQVFDTITGIWRNIGNGGITVHLNSDGVNHRLANQTGCAVGALITNAGSGYTSPPIVTPSGGASVWSAIVGGAVNTSVTVSSGGANYVYPPEVDFAAPPQGGIQATGYATLSSGAVSTVTVTNQGAGYTAPPAIDFINDMRDTTGAGAAANCALTGAGTITGVLATDHGNPVTSVPTLAFTGGGGSAAAATAIMCWSITAYTASGGTGYTVGAGAVLLSALTRQVAGVAAYTNPATDKGIVRQRPAYIIAPTTAGGGITATGQVIIDGGIYEIAPAAGDIIITNGGLYPSQSTLAVAMGGQNDFTELYPV